MFIVLHNIMLHLSCYNSSPHTLRDPYFSFSTITTVVSHGVLGSTHKEYLGPSIYLQSTVTTLTNRNVDHSAEYMQVTINLCHVTH